MCGCIRVIMHPKHRSPRRVLLACSAWVYTYGCTHCRSLHPPIFASISKGWSASSLCNISMYQRPHCPFWLLWLTGVSRCLLFLSHRLYSLALLLSLFLPVPLVATNLSAPSFPFLLFCCFGLSPSSHVYRLASLLFYPSFLIECSSPGAELLLLIYSIL